jgi:putative tricarboxylic transport membrane protein
MTLTMTTIAGIAAVVLGAVYSWLAWRLPRAPVGNPVGPLIFPLIVGYGMILLGAGLVVQELLRQRKAGPAGGGAGVRLALTRYGRYIAIVTGFCLLYAFLFERAGYVLSTFLFLEATLLLFNGRRKWKMTLVVSIGFSVGVYVLFSRVLGIPLPAMPLVGY